MEFMLNQYKGRVLMRRLQRNYDSFYLTNEIRFGPEFPRNSIGINGNRFY